MKSKILSVLIILLALIGAGLSIFTVVLHYQVLLDPEHASQLCHFTEKINCAPVVTSEYAQLFGIPLGSFGLVFYGVIFLLGILNTRYKVSGVLRLYTLLACVVSVGLFLLSHFVIGALCPICLALYGVNALLFVCSLLVSTEFSGSGCALGAVRTTLASPLRLLRGDTKGIAWLSLVIILTLLVFALIIPAKIEEIIFEQLAARDSAPDMVAERLAEWKKQSATQFPALVESGLNKDYSFGPPDAPIVVVEFSDFECPACRHFHLILESLREQFAGAMRIVHLDFPIDAQCNPGVPEGHGHKNACFAAQFARCGGEQSKYWETADMLFTLPELEEEKDATKVQEGAYTAASGLGLDITALKECVTSGRHIPKLQSDMQSAIALGLQATPTVWVNGKRVARWDEPTLAAIMKSIVGM